MRSPEMPILPLLELPIVEQQAEREMMVDALRRELKAHPEGVDRDMLEASVAEQLHRFPYEVNLAFYCLDLVDDLGATAQLAPERL